MAVVHRTVLTVLCRQQDANCNAVDTLWSRLLQRLSDSKMTFCRQPGGCTRERWQA